MSKKPPAKAPAKPTAPAKPPLQDTLDPDAKFQSDYDKVNKNVTNLQAQLDALSKGGRITDSAAYRKLQGQLDKAVTSRDSLVAGNDKRHPGTGTVSPAPGGNSGQPGQLPTVNPNSPPGSGGVNSGQQPPIDSGDDGTVSPNDPTSTTPGTTTPGSSPTIAKDDPSSLQSGKISTTDAPALGKFNYTPGQGTDLSKGIIDSATNGTLTSFNTSANRLRERLDSAGAGQAQAASDANLGRGFGNSGRNDKQLSDVRAGTQNAYAQGLNDLSNTFETQRQQGLSTASSTAGRLLGNEEAQNGLQQKATTDDNTLGQDAWKFGNSQRQQNAQFQDTTLTGQQNSREQRSADDAQAARKDAFDRFAKTGDWRTSLSNANTVANSQAYGDAIHLGDNKYGTPGVPTGTTAPVGSIPSYAVPASPTAPPPTTTTPKTGGVVGGGTYLGINGAKSFNAPALDGNMTEEELQRQRQNAPFKRPPLGAM